MDSTEESQLQEEVSRRETCSESQEERDEAEGQEAQVVQNTTADLINVEQEADERVIAEASRQEAAWMSFISPYAALRVSPVEAITATIGLQDELGIEHAINSIKSMAPSTEKLHLLVNTPGGGMNSSYKIARALRLSFKEVIVFVPHIAASGGTLIALAGNTIVMGLMSQLSPLDVQVQYKDTIISCNTFALSFGRACKWFEKVQPQEMPYPYKALADQFDPYIMEEWSRRTGVALQYTQDILQDAGYNDNEAEKIAKSLVMGYFQHGQVLHEDEVREIGIHVVNAAHYADEWTVMRYWLGLYMTKEAATHHIRYLCPEV